MFIINTPEGQASSPIVEQLQFTTTLRTMGYDPRSVNDMHYAAE